ncbi:phosphoglycerol geranylgeranyltransferase [Cyclobacterium marinum]|uniref:Geranylgeranylglyceryl phosphate synthase n=1 Tax=Cyclobacterium marinum (strain ATCC 25205 / DSM 745 / LMG 13164 / NCIMB 1802) TaxID=880070 RepID=G0J0W0_CYCMS|nr:geranylgeranylglyceryl/heptaprenylglyceryl phosphate synthase [Cyclobacterium marinum]AEL25086.1 Geranylgeranylglyceryl phosphate synthase [Cyclobacterium marinum DSM 745]MBI0401443.1 geranylgeranylglyceryl/heptaprenylglyceryl phosphate synthase [Cyclobacterium marinum]MBR9776737.1 geranylgeranylglyceryl/heptaprenylglyceryl phosphate synthase [Cytophagales bacterium]|tara:strand:- start:70391 stop:71176 length:786 start_codon:yes stop_codon:yes gene_type:complete
MKENRINALRELLKEKKKKGEKSLALLIDPEKLDKQPSLDLLKQLSHGLRIDYFFVGGSLVAAKRLDQCLRRLKEVTQGNVPIVLFPGSVMQISGEADAILFLSLISGRNPDLLIGQHVLAAPTLAKSNLEVLPVGYMLVNGGVGTSVEYISQTIPIPHNKPDIAVATALAGKYLGLPMFYLDAGSGAKTPVSKKMIKAVSEQVKCPLLVGGGIRSLKEAKAAWAAGADILVIGNGAEKNPSLITEVLHYAKIYNSSLNVN